MIKGCNLLHTFFCINCLLLEIEGMHSCFFLAKGCVHDACFDVKRCIWIQIVCPTNQILWNPQTDNPINLVKVCIAFVHTNISHTYIVGFGVVLVH